MTHELQHGCIQQQKPKRRIFCDMDGCLCEWNESAQFSDLFEKDYFLNLPALDNNVEAVKALIAGGEDIYILSSVISQHAIECKNKWLDEHLPIPMEKRIFVKYGDNKSDYIKVEPTDILLDDYSINLMSWPAKSIKILNSINGKNGKFKGLRLMIQKPEDLLNAINAV